MGLLETTAEHILNPGEPFSYDEGSDGRIRPMDGSSLPLENTDFTSETLQRLTRHRTPANLFHSGMGDGNDEITRKRLERDRRLENQEIKDHDALVARKLAAKETWTEMESAYSRGKDVSGSDNVSRVVTRSHDESESRHPPAMKHTCHVVDGQNEPEGCSTNPPEAEQAPSLDRKAPASFYDDPTHPSFKTTIPSIGHRRHSESK